MVLLMCAVVGVVLLGQRLQMPYPTALIIGGLGISLVPGLPVVRINPECVLLLFLPPLRYAAGWFTSSDPIPARRTSRSGSPASTQSWFDHLRKGAAVSGAGGRSLA